MLNTVNIICTINASHGITLLLKKAFLCFKHWILLSEKRLRFFFGVIVLALLDCRVIDNRYDDDEEEEEEG